MTVFKNILLSGSLCLMFNVSNAQTIAPENPIADMLDSLSTQKMFSSSFFKSTYPKNNKFKFAEDSVPVYDDYTYQSRLAKLDGHSPFDLIYNEHVRAFINLYTVRKRESVSRMMGMAQLYYPMFEEIMDKYNIPLELKHLAVIESALIPYARSRVGAMGLWQFMYPTGKMYGLDVTSYIDERCDPYKATTAAAEYLKNLYSMFGDWQMVLAAYNAGPGTISKAIRRSGGKKTYWEIRPYLPTETQGYVPAFIAANYVMNFAPEHNIYPLVPRKTYFEVDTVVVKEQLTFEQISQVLEVSAEEILYFNPQYRKNMIPSGGNTMCLPKNKIAYFLNNELVIYEAIREQMQATHQFEIVEVKRYHTVKRGERLSAIARTYGVSVEDIRTWNYLGKREAKSGKKIMLYVREQRTMPSPPLDLRAAIIKNNEIDTANKLLAQKAPKDDGFIYHRVDKGETIYSLARQYSTEPQLIINLNSLNDKVLSLGQMLKVKQKGE